MVQITKIALRKILGKALVFYKELQTILAEIEAIINSRPLTYVYNEPNEPFSVTPDNFLTGRRLSVLPNWSDKRNIELLKGKKELIKRYLYREKILNNFWKRWKREYLLQSKGVNLNKNVNVKTEFNINDIVLIGEEKVPRQLWKLGKVTDVHKGRDSKVRSASIQTSTGLKSLASVVIHCNVKGSSCHAEAPGVLNDSRCISSSTEAGVLVAHHRATARSLLKEVRTITGGRVTQPPPLLYPQGKRVRAYEAATPPCTRGVIHCKDSIVCGDIGYHNLTLWEVPSLSPYVRYLAKLYL
ncbi:hypothetical protein AVEN_215715-1 [Araneus ventricosus]|uniref:DUF5641 domain-containing protein n=1 Tax=Araneus ventricosus TaxID=182803 RepID=A0A4Y2QLG7_ARAVE|nr:hypothetical protein AVEN_215715-1 [Araneus ventricosus]